MSETELHIKNTLDGLRTNQRKQVLDTLKAHPEAKISEDTLTRHRERLGQWSALEIIVLALRFDVLGNALRAHLDQPFPSTGTPKQAYADAVQELEKMGDLTSTISRSLRDGNIDAREAREILVKLHDMSGFINKTLIPGLEAVSRRP